MGTKNQPGVYDCYSKAEPDEPMFVLLGRDPVASILVEEWARLRGRLGKTEFDALSEARQCAQAMREYAEKQGKRFQILRAQDQQRVNRASSSSTWWKIEHARECEQRTSFGDAYATEEEACARHDRCDPKTGCRLLHVMECELRTPNADRFEIEHLRALCHRAADVIEKQVEINESDGGLRGRDALTKLVEELRSA